MTSTDNKKLVKQNAGKIVGCIKIVISKKEFEEMAS
jgi:hypothetical protein